MKTDEQVAASIARKTLGEDHSTKFKFAVLVGARCLAAGRQEAIDEMAARSKEIERIVRHHQGNARAHLNGTSALEGKIKEQSEELKAKDARIKALKARIEKLREALEDYKKAEDEAKYTSMVAGLALANDDLVGGGK